MSDPIGVYIHVPFCRSKCPYCDFYSQRDTEEAMDIYTAALLRHIRTSPRETVDTVYLGGGTPTLLGANRLQKIVEGVAAHFSLTPRCEITTEANPRASEEETIAALGRLGINRLSFGVQSAIPQELTLLGRSHSRQEIAQSVALARRGGIENLSLDLMLGVIGQTPDSLSETLSFALSFAPQHISAYILKVEENTPYNAPRFRDRIPGEDLQADLYLQTVETLEHHGLKQYEISNFAQKGYESRHNLKYWHCESYLGFGPAAHSYYGGERFACPPDLAAFCQARDFSCIPFVKQGPGGGLFEEVMLGLRLTEGICLDKLERRYQVDFSPLRRACPPLCKQGLATLEGERLFLTPKGFLVSNAVITYLLDTVVS